MQDGVVEAKTIEPDHPSVGLFEPHHKVNDGPGVIAPRAYLKRPLQRCITMLDCHREYIWVSFQIPAVVITHLRTTSFPENPEFSNIVTLGFPYAIRQLGAFAVSASVPSTK